MQIAGLEVLIAQQAYWPTPSVSMERAQTQLPDPSYAGSPQILTFRLQQPLWTGGRLKAQTNKALANQEIESARFAEIQQTLALKTLQAWAEVNSAKRQQWVLSRSHETQIHLQKQIERRFDQGLSARSEVTYSSLRLSQILQDLRHAQQQESHAWIHLRQWVPDVQMLFAQVESQLDHTSVNSVAILASELAHIELPQWESLSIARSPTMLRLTGILQVQLAELQEKRASLQPEVYLRAEHQRGNYAYSGLPPANRILWV